MKNQDKIKEAQKILDSLKESLTDILWEDPKEMYNSSRCLIPWMQEDAEYAIKKLSLNKENETHCLKLVQRIVGEYTDDV